MLDAVRRRGLGFMRREFIAPLEGQLREVIFQRLFAQQCNNLGISNDYYPLGAAANYSLLYLIARILSETDVRSIVEFGSGESTRLIDSVRKDDTSHVCVEDSAAWHELVAKRLRRCQYERRDLSTGSYRGVQYGFYRDVPKTQFDLLLVDGPRWRGEKYSRFGCVDYAVQHARQDCIVIVDDIQREADRRTLNVLTEELRGSHPDLELRKLTASKTQAVLAAGNFQHVLHYW